mmetsp:Transcript_94996/g.307329  ORF Transcript_94996/g.307329 Transcript_94996/m.307329 type:complete len:220 (-) Transcript_94996:409-1068(-)
MVTAQVLLCAHQALELRALLGRELLGDLVHEAGLFIRHEDERDHAEEATKDDADDTRDDHKIPDKVQPLLRERQVRVRQTQSVGKALNEALKRDTRGIGHHLAHPGRSQSGKPEGDPQGTIEGLAHGKHDHVVEKTEADKRDGSPHKQLAHLHALGARQCIRARRGFKRGGRFTRGRGLLGRTSSARSSRKCQSPPRCGPRVYRRSQLRAKGGVRTSTC